MSSLPKKALHSHAWTVALNLCVSLDLFFIYYFFFKGALFDFDFRYFCNVYVILHSLVVLTALRRGDGVSFDLEKVKKDFLLYVLFWLNYKKINLEEDEITTKKWQFWRSRMSRIRFGFLEIKDIFFNKFGFLLGSPIFVEE